MVSWELLQKVKDRYHNGGGKEEAAEYYLKNRKVLKENANDKYRSLPEEEKGVKKKYNQNSCKNIKEKTSQVSIK